MQPAVGIGWSSMGPIILPVFCLFYLICRIRLNLTSGYIKFLPRTMVFILQFAVRLVCSPVFPYR